MCKKILFILFVLITSELFSQTEYNRIKKIDDGLFFMYFDSSGSKSTIVEFKDYLAILEMPIIDKGGGANELKDDIVGGEKVIRTLNNYFPNKPIKYLMHSHWHMHSISSITPFLNDGVSIVSTKMNFDVIKNFMDSGYIQKNIDKFIFVEGDSLTFSDEQNNITAYHFYQKDFPSTPTKDYLYFYLPRYNCMHAACMYTKWTGEPIDGKQVLSGREENLYGFIKNRNINPEYLIRLTNEKEEPNDMQSFKNLTEVNTNGLKSSDVLSKYTSLDALSLKNNRDEIVKDVIERKIPASFFNGLVYSELRKKELERALSFAIIQTMVNPSDANAWDTLGEVYYFLGDVIVAKNYEKMRKKMFPSAESGGEEVWKKDLEEHKIIWEKMK